MAKEHPKFEKLWEAEHNDDAKPRLGPRLCRRGLLGQPKQIIKTLLGQGDLANFNIETLKNTGYGDTLEENGQEALEKSSDMRQGKRSKRSWTTSTVRR